MLYIWISRIVNTIYFPSLSGLDVDIYLLALLSGSVPVLVVTQLSHVLYQTQKVTPGNLVVVEEI